MSKVYPSNSIKGVTILLLYFIITLILSILLLPCFALIFFSIWMTAYDGVNDRLDHLEISIVNEDKEAGVAMDRFIKRTVTVSYHKSLFPVISEEGTEQTQHQHGHSYSINVYPGHQ
jgi:hypothetical protein